MIHLRNSALPALIGAGVLATACASSPAAAGSKTAAQIVPAMRAAVQSATSVRMSGSGPDGSQKITFDMTFVGSKDMSGTFTENGATLTIEAVSNRTYLRVNLDFLSLAKLPASFCGTICGKYVELPATESSQITGAISLSALTQRAFNTIPAAVSTDTSDVFVPATLHGQPVLALTQGGWTMDVAASGKPFPLQLSSAKEGTFTFSDWNSVPPLAPPPASEVISLTSL